jgi:thiosulfate/3-mercaptopyruvate sulfurtransferase
MSAAGYAHPEYLVETGWLAEHFDDPGLRLIDCAPLDAYNRAHIPGAVALPLHSHLKDPANDTLVLPPDQFAALMGKLGVGADTLVVAYDGDQARQSTRMWWTLNYYGHSNVKVLNGGWHKWLAEGRSVTTVPNTPASATFTPRIDALITCLVDDLKQRAGRTGEQILDARSDAEWAGAESRGNKRSGRVPGAKHLEWSNFVTADETRVFRPADELRAMFTAAGFSPDSEIVTYCQGGVRAAHAMFALRLAGYEQVRNYDGSMKEWANRDDTPLVV